MSIRREGKEREDGFYTNITSNNGGQRNRQHPDFACLTAFVFLEGKERMPSLCVEAVCQLVQEQHMCKYQNRKDFMDDKTLMWK